ncbi:Rieske domain-containing protein-like [Mizuhopecten yessoensis]|uniref:Rieske domain-containing protein n=1 Tax=Mizuhopecten yessoensis TaxID=6573 RepID=A0A210PYV8_MIZYE|nr:Rieske domain-containing protein-like [Mizuhopecten yessoensis]OWF41668.1 Rieske domain-containing protein [Mizuhopecten yessoensis]
MMETKLFFPVKELTYKELFDWADPVQRYKTSSVSVPRKNGLLRQNSRTGSLVDCNKMKIALFRHGERVFAVDEKCPHAGGPLHLGDIEEIPGGGLCVRCPWHSWRFDLDTGKSTMPRGRDLLMAIYPVRVDQDGIISIGFDKFADSYFSAEEEF